MKPPLTSSFFLYAPKHHITSVLFMEQWLNCKLTFTTSESVDVVYLYILHKSAEGLLQLGSCNYSDEDLCCAIFDEGCKDFISSRYLNPLAS